MTQVHEGEVPRSFQKLKFVVLRKTVEATEAAEFLSATAYPRARSDILPAVRTDISLPEIDQIFCFIHIHYVPVSGLG